jgi:hypothetical protein
VSLLWPDQIAGGLFHGQCWLTRKGVEKSVVPLVQDDAPAALLATLSTLLDEHGTSLRKRTRVSLVVSDSLAALMPLTWHANLRTQDEIHAYARACFQKRGEEIDAQWVMQAAFRRYGEAGLAYALPRAWVEALVALLAARGLVLDRVLPITAQAFWKARLHVLSGQEVLLLREATRTGAMVFDANGLLGIDAEAGAGQPQLSERRLLGRIAAFYPQVWVVQEWSEQGAEKRSQATFITDMLPDTGVTAVYRSAWS